MNPFDVFNEDRPVMTRQIGRNVNPQNVIKLDHSASEKLYREYLAKAPELAKLRDYAEQVVKATHGAGMTPVAPLATMNRGGALICDHCGKPMLLEGGKFNKVYVDKAWEMNPDPKWRSWIKGGMVIRIVDNGTLRVYHGYEGTPDHCDTLAMAIYNAAEKAFRKDNTAIHKMALYLSEIGKIDELSDVVATVLSFDPGLGVNRP